MIREIIQLGDPLLRKISVTVTPDDGTMPQIWRDLDDTLSHQMTLHSFTKSAGLSAVQIGHLVRVCIVQLPDKSWRSIANPVVAQQSDTENEAFEGCLSFYDKRGLVPRPNSIQLQYVDREGNSIDEKLEGWAARIVLHEIDHMDGILYIDRMRASERLMDLDEYRQLKQ